MVENHPFETFIPNSPRILILGSFPCQQNLDYGDWFYSGSGKNQFWSILSGIFSMPIDSFEEKKALCVKNNIAICDIFLSIDRKKAGCEDIDLVKIEFNRTGIENCVQAGVKKILCTSKYVAKECIIEMPHLAELVKTLPSPSPNGGRSIGRQTEYKRLLESGEVKNTIEYKIQKYKQELLS